MASIAKILLVLFLVPLVSCGSGSSDEPANETGDDGVDTEIRDDDDPARDGDSAEDNDESDSGAHADEEQNYNDSDNGNEISDEDAGFEELQTGGIYIFSGFDESGNAESREILGNGGFFGFSILSLSDKYWAVSAIHESIPAFDWDKATGKLYIFEKEKRVEKLEDAAFVLGHPEKSLNVGFGYAATELCDINGDGFDDLAVSSHLATFNNLSAAGEIVVFYGGGSGWNENNASISRLSSEYMQKADSMSQSLACLDYDNDGFADVFAGGQNAGPELEGGGSQGMVALFKGSAAGLSEHENSVLLPEVEEKAQYFGSGMITDDFNGDTLPDLAVAGWGLKKDESSANSGGVYIYSGGNDWKNGAAEKIFGLQDSQFGSMVKVVDIAEKKHLGVLAPKEEKYGAVYIFDAGNFSSTAVLNVPEMPELGEGTLSDFDIIKISETSDLLIAGGKTFGSGGMILCAKIENGMPATAFEKCPFQPASPEGGFGYSVKNIGNGEIVVGKPEYIHRF